MTSKEEFLKRYDSAAHAMQSGVAHDMNYNDSHSPKHLRVGINSAHVGQLALANLLIQKGVFTEEEYFEQMALAMEKERKSYEDKYGVHFG